MDHSTMMDHQMMMAAGYDPILMLLLPMAHNLTLIAFFWCFAVMVQAFRA